MVDFCTGVYGPRGSGKSTLAAKLARASSRVVIFDPADSLAKMLSAPHVRDLSALHDFMKTRMGGPFRVAWVPPDDRAPGALSALAHYLRDVQDVTGHRHRLTLVADELSVAYPVHMLPAGCGGFTGLILRGRHYAIDLIGVAQRPAEVSKTFVGNTSDSYWFRFTAARDRQLARDVLGTDATRDVGALGRFEYLHMDHRTGRVTKAKTRRR